MDRMVRRVLRSGSQSPPWSSRPHTGDETRDSEAAWPVRVHVDEPGAGETVREAVWQAIHRAGGYARNIIVVCIGTDRSTGDALGPLTGHQLTTLVSPEAAVFGTLEEPVHAGNLSERMLEIHRLYPGHVVVAVDACLGSLENVGTICVGLGALRPGAGVNKDLPPVGDLHVTGVVNVGGFMEYFVLQNTRLHLVMKMSSVIAQGLAGLVDRPALRRAAIEVAGRSAF
jgi:putative sporulation protein YyaC